MDHQPSLTNLLVHCQQVQRSQDHPGCVCRRGRECHKIGQCKLMQEGDCERVEQEEDGVFVEQCQGVLGGFQHRAQLGWVYEIRTAGH